jgi:hypothetical protein
MFPEGVSNRSDVRSGGSSVGLAEGEIERLSLTDDVPVSRGSLPFDEHAPSTRRSTSDVRGWVRRRVPIRAA